MFNFFLLISYLIWTIYIESLQESQNSLPFEFCSGSNRYVDCCVHCKIWRVLYKPHIICSDWYGLIGKCCHGNFILFGVNIPSSWSEGFDLKAWNIYGELLVLAYMRLGMANASYANWPPTYAFFERQWELRKFWNRLEFFRNRSDWNSHYAKSLRIFLNISRL